MTEQPTTPPAQLSVRPGVRLGGSDDALLLRPYYFSDGDGTNAIITCGVKLGTKHADPLIDFGLDLVIPPWLFWLFFPVDTIRRLVSKRQPSGDSR